MTVQLRYFNTVLFVINWTYCSCTALYLRNPANLARNLARAGPAGFLKNGCIPDLLEPETKSSTTQLKQWSLFAHLLLSVSVDEFWKNQSIFDLIAYICGPYGSWISTEELSSVHISSQRHAYDCNTNTNNNDDYVHHNVYAAQTSYDTAEHIILFHQMTNSNTIKKVYQNFKKNEMNRWIHTCLTIIITAHKKDATKLLSVSYPNIDWF